VPTLPGVRVQIPPPTPVKFLNALMSVFLLQKTCSLIGVEPKLAALPLSRNTRRESKIKEPSNEYEQVKQNNALNIRSDLAYRAISIQN
jgi:hypothetical protein